MKNEYIINGQLYRAVEPEPAPEWDGAVKVGDWVKQPRFSSAYQVRSVRDGYFWLESIPNAIDMDGKGYTIVPAPEPPPEPETFTGNTNPLYWGAGVYFDPEGKSIVIVDISGGWCWLSFDGGVYKSDSVYGLFTRISTNPTDAIDLEKLRAMKGGQ